MNTHSAPTVDESGTKKEKSPLWKYVTIIRKLGKDGGNVEFQCNYCHNIYKGSHYRVRSHLMKEEKGGIKSCPKVTQAHMVEMQKLLDEAMLKKKQSQPKNVRLPTGSLNSDGTTPFVPNKKRGLNGNGPLEKAWNTQAREQVHEQIARMFYTGGLSFHLARNPHYVRAFGLLSNLDLRGYIPPGYNMLRTTLLQKERANVERELEPIKKTWPDKGVSLCSDGWSDIQRRPLINVMVVCESGPMFLKATNCEGQVKDKYFISNLLIDTIQEIGPSSVVQVITDNAQNCKSAGLLVEAKYSHIFWTPCVVHTLNLALKNICAPVCSEKNQQAWDECCWIYYISQDASMIRNFIMNHNMRLNIFNQNNSLKLFSIAETRFASTIVLLRRFKLLKHGLKSMVIDEKWDLYREDDVGKAKMVKDKILDDEFWDNIDYILSFIGPIYDILRKADTDAPCLHLVYEWWDSMIEKVKEIIYKHEHKSDNEESMFFQVVFDILVARWTKSSTPLHCLAHSLNPKYYSLEWLGEAPNRLPPHKDVEISRDKKCFERYFPNKAERRKITEEFSSFSGCCDDFGNGDSLRDRAFLSPQKWWLAYGESTPMLQALAIKLLGQPCSPSCCERNWSTYKFVHSVKRNKMLPQRAEDLVFVHNNLRLLSRRTQNYNQGETKMWDVGGDDFDSMDSANGGVLEVANLSLDEPELEAILFADDGVVDICGDGDEMEMEEH